jgi:hypothetical protein
MAPLWPSLAQRAPHERGFVLIHLPAEHLCPSHRLPSLGRRVGASGGRLVRPQTDHSAVTGPGIETDPMAPPTLSAQLRALNPWGRLPAGPDSLAISALFGTYSDRHGEGGRVGVKRFSSQGHFLRKNIHKGD